MKKEAEDKREKEEEEWRAQRGERKAGEAVDVGG